MPEGARQRRPEAREAAEGNDQEFRFPSEDACLFSVLTSSSALLVNLLLSSGALLANLLLSFSVKVITTVLCHAGQGSRRHVDHLS